MPTTEYTGIVLRQTKATGSLRMLSVFTREAGIIDFGTRISEKSKGGAALAIRPFTYGRYIVSEHGGAGNTDPRRTITSAETIDAHFALGENAGRFADASFVLEFTAKALPHGARAEEIFELLRTYLSMICLRKKDIRLLTISYLIKVAQELGVFPDRAALMGAELPTGMNDDILNAIMFIGEKSLSDMANLALNPETEKAIFRILMDFAHDSLALGHLKSERLLD